MAAQFMRFEAVGMEGFGEGWLAKHVRGETRSKQTNEGARAGHGVLALFPDREEEARALLAADTATRTGRTGRPKGGYDIVVSGPPRWRSHEFIETGWTEERAESWGRDVVGWFEKNLLTGSILARAMFHKDEGAPHVHLLLIPFSAELGRMDYAAVRAKLAGEAVSLPAPRLSRRKCGEQMQSIHDRLHADVSSGYGIERGDRGNGKRRRALQRRKAAEAEEKDAKEAAERAKKELAALERQSDLARHHAYMAMLPDAGKHLTEEEKVTLRAMSRRHRSVIADQSPEQSV